MKQLLNILPVISLITIVILVTILSLLPPESGFELKKDKLGHLIAYMALASNTFYFSRSGLQLVALFLLVCGYGAILEFLQGFIPGRQPSGWDMVANSTGALIGVILHLSLGRMLKKLIEN